jgi:mannosyltransferase
MLGRHETTVEARTARGADPSAVGPRSRSEATYAEGVVVVALTALALAIRFTKLGSQSFWEDETVTTSIIQGNLHSLLLHVRSLENTPPFYHLAAWAWTKATGIDEVGLRSLSALLGAAVVPLAYFAARSLAGRRAAVLAGLLAALGPMLVWYSQEARSYALYSFCSAISFLFFARTLARYRALDLAGWTVGSVLALAAHYFAGFLVLAEALVLFRRAPRRPFLLSVAPVVATGLALLPLLFEQRSSGRSDALVEGIGVWSRFRQLGYWFATGNLRSAAALVVVLVATGAGVWLLLRRTDRRERAHGLTAFGVGLATIAVPAVLVAFGLDYVFFRNLIAAWVPLAVGIAVGCSARRPWSIGVGAAGALCAVFLLADIAVFTRPGLQRDDWRSAARIVTASPGPAAFLVYPDWEARVFGYYARPARAPKGPSIRVREIWFLGVPGAFQSDYTAWPRPETVQIDLPPGFREVSRRHVQHVELRHFVSRRPLSISVARLARAKSGDPLRVFVD